MTDSSRGSYDPDTFSGLTFHDRPAAFESGADDPRAYLERCLEVIAEREPTVKAYVHLNENGAREAADASAARWRASSPLSPIDGMPVSIKDLLETKDMPTEMGCEAYQGNFPKRDNAAVWALREAGAVVLGKTVTAEIGGSQPGATTNPFHPDHTPGGSSSGSAAAVAAGMVPAAIGSQVGGSIIRPSGFCGNVALKPSQGGINRGERQATSMSTHGVHANGIEDMWQVTIEIVKRAGGDRGFPGLTGPDTPPAPRRPNRLIRLDTEGWSRLDDRSGEAFETLIGQLVDAGVEILGRRDNVLIDTLEKSVAEASRICSGITGWENRWATRSLVDGNPGGVSERAQQVLARAEAMSVAHYRALLIEREQAQRCFDALRGMADGCLTLACPGPAPLWLGDRPGEPLAPRPTGDAVFNYPTSMLFAPCVTLPLMAVGGLPVGAQVVGLPQDDAQVTGLARWALQNLKPITIG